jgi:uncharacterized protein YndB with AHSA1/START domain
MKQTTKANEDGLGQKFLMTRELNAPREAVFKAWTDPAHLARWWGPKGFTNPVCELDVRPGGAIYVVMRAPDGTDYPMGGEYREIVPPERLVFTSGALDEKGKMMFEFLHVLTLVERNGQTTMTLDSEVIKTTPGAGRYIGGFEMGMTQTLERLTEQLAAKSEPLVVERIYNAPAAKVWSAITNKEEMKRWYFDLKEFKPEVGFEFQFVVEHEGNTYSHHCQVKEVIPQKRLAYSWRYDGQEGDSLVTFELFADGNRTRMKLTHEGLESFPKTPAYARKNFEGGWTQIIGTSLKEYVEGGPKKS